MSYNISSWRTKKISKLVVSYDDIKKVSGDIEIELTSISTVKISGLCAGFEIEGKVDPHQSSIEIKRIEYYGEGSGMFWDDFKDLLSKSKGELVATQVWEGGDSITRLTVKDGKVAEEGIDL